MALIEEMIMAGEGDRDSRQSLALRGNNTPDDVAGLGCLPKRQPGHEENNRHEKNSFSHKILLEKKTSFFKR
jgi:hypothetical protein